MKKLAFFAIAAVAFAGLNSSTASVTGTFAGSSIASDTTKKDTSKTDTSKTDTTSIKLRNR